VARARGAAARVRSRAPVPPAHPNALRLAAAKVRVQRGRAVGGLYAGQDRGGARVARPQRGVGHIEVPGIVRGEVGAAARGRVLGRVPLLRALAAAQRLGPRLRRGRGVRRGREQQQEARRGGGGRARGRAARPRRARRPRRRACHAASDQEGLWDAGNPARWRRGGCRGAIAVPPPGPTLWVGGPPVTAGSGRPRDRPRPDVPLAGGRRRRARRGIGLWRGWGGGAGGLVCGAPGTFAGRWRCWQSGGTGRGRGEASARRGTPSLPARCGHRAALAGHRPAGARPPPRHPGRPPPRGPERRR
jgi:hypothetical protein